MYLLTTPVAIATIQKLQSLALQPMESSKRYNSVPVRDNCALFAPTPLFSTFDFDRKYLKNRSWYWQRTQISWRAISAALQKKTWWTSVY